MGQSLSILKYLAGGILILIFSGCGIFDDLPGNFSGTLTKEPGLEGFDDASGTAELHFADNEIHVTLSGMPEAEEGCMVRVYATTDEGTTAIGMVMMTEEAHEDEEGEMGDEEGMEESEGEHEGLILAQEEEEHEEHFGGTLEADAHDLGIELHEITEVSCYIECNDGTREQIFGIDFESASAEEGEGAEGGGGHTH